MEIQRTSDGELIDRGEYPRPRNQSSVTTSMAVNTGESHTAYEKTSTEPETQQTVQIFGKILTGFSLPNINRHFSH